MSEGWLQVAREALKLPALLVEVYGDLMRPGVRQVGKAMETVFGLGNTVLWPIAWANERSRFALERNLENYRRQMEAIPEEKVVAVAPEVGVPIAEKLAYVRDEKLSSLYVNLLVKASCTETLDQAHPSFVNVVNNLSPDEATLLECFNSKSELPFLEARSMVPQKGSFSVLQSFIVSAQVEASLAFPKNLAAYVSNLSGLGLVDIQRNQWVDNEPAYEELKAAWTPYFTALIQQTERIRDRTLELERGVICVTEFGHLFVAACHAK